MMQIRKRAPTARIEYHQLLVCGLVLFHFQGLDLGFFEFGQEVRGGLVGISRGILVGEDESGRRFGLGIRWLRFHSFFPFT